MFHLSEAAQDDNSQYRSRAVYATCPSRGDRNIDRNNSKLASFRPCLTQCSESRATVCKRLQSARSDANAAALRHPSREAAMGAQEERAAFQALILAAEIYVP